MRAKKNTAGFTLVELAVVVALVAILAAVSAPQLNQWLATQRVKSSARAIADALLLARAEAMRTSNNFVVFFRANAVGTADPAGTAIVDVNGNAVAILILNDGLAAAANCQIEAGEWRQTVPFEPGVAWGVSQATARVPLDTTAPPIGNGVTFANPEALGNAVNWVLFRPDGIPVAFSGDPALGCDTVGSTGSGRGGLYVTNGRRDYAVALMPLGGIRVHAWELSAGQWTN